MGFRTISLLYHFEVTEPIIETTTKISLQETLREGADDEFGSRDEDRPLVVHICSSTRLKSLRSLRSGWARNPLHRCRLTREVDLNMARAWRRMWWRGVSTDSMVLRGLARLEMSRSGLRDSDAEMLRATLASLTGLQALDVSYNEQLPATQLLIDVLPSLASLACLNISGTRSSIADLLRFIDSCVAVSRDGRACARGERNQLKKLSIDFLPRMLKDGVSSLGILSNKVIGKDLVTDADAEKAAKRFGETLGELECLEELQVRHRFRRILTIEDPGNILGHRCFGISTCDPRYVAAGVGALGRSFWLRWSAIAHARQRCWGDVAWACQVASSPTLGHWTGEA